jgi:hypothetical protein
METGTNPHPMKNTQRASQEAFFVSRGVAKLSMVKPLSTFPPSAASEQQQYSIFLGGEIGCSIRNRRPKKIVIYFFIPKHFLIFAI